MLRRKYALKDEMPKMKEFKVLEFNEANNVLLEFPELEGASNEVLLQIARDMVGLSSIETIEAIYVGDSKIDITSVIGVTEKKKSAKRAKRP